MHLVTMTAVFRGFVLSESLKDPTILNKFKTIYVHVEEHPESKDARFWHLFKVEVPGGSIEKVARKFAEELKYGWYAHFWNGKTVYVCFAGKVFKIPQENVLASREFHEVKKYAIKNGVEERYCDLLIED